jgi:hypothetical protein
MLERSEERRMGLDKFTNDVLRTIMLICKNTIVWCEKHIKETGNPKIDNCYYSKP